MMKTETVALSHPEFLDVFELARKHLLVAVFAKTNSPYYKLAVNVAAGAHLYRLHEIEKLSVHVCAFARTPEEAARATALLGYIETWASTQVFVGGRMAKPSELYRLANTLRCYQSASSCNNPDAHCLDITAEVFKARSMSRTGGMSINVVVHDGVVPPPAPAIPLPRFVIPCKLAFQNNSLHRDHPASWREQIQAQAVSHETDWCPRFNAGKFSQLD